jgi:hypothetical protein
MTVERKFQITSIAAAVFAAAAIGSWAAWIARSPRFFNPAFLYNATSHIESPIVASGGSMTFRSQSTWNCSAPSNQVYVCITSGSISSLSASGLYMQNPSNNSQYYAAPTTITSSAKIRFYLRQSNGTPSTSGVQSIVLCTSSSSSYDSTCNGTGNVQIQAYNATNSNYPPVLVASNAVEPNSTYAPQTYAEQYFDPTCLVHGSPPNTPTQPATDVPLTPIPACEHPGYVTWVDNNTYACVEGACWVNVD